MHDASQPVLDACSIRVAVIYSRYHAAITERLRDGAVETFLKAGGSWDRLEIIPVPGSWELVAAARSVCDSGSSRSQAVDAIITLGCIITGETIHDQVIANAIANGLINLTVQSGVPITLGVLTCRTMEQAVDRAGGAHGNKGIEAMSAAIELASTIRTRNSQECVR